MGADADTADLDMFQSAGAQSPGEYLVEVFLNDRNQGQRTLTFNRRETQTDQVRSRDNTGLSVCLTKEMMASLGVKIALFPELKSLGKKYA